MTGVVASTRIDDNPYNPRGGALYKARVIADSGFTVWMTLPRALGDAPLCDLVDRRIRFVADLVAPKNGDDPSFCLAKRPVTPWWSPPP
ncbi:hypothetical protein [Actinokineospora terrae]|uniref:hypothetical protein n=1 Tax=Actinokineospora terrae TaxID=155974 RepID=UPI001160A898|nr:hypothetical protein [Actinokineospora terrae]